MQPGSGRVERARASLKLDLLRLPPVSARTKQVILRMQLRSFKTQLRAAQTQSRGSYSRTDAGGIDSLYWSLRSSSWSPKTDAVSNKPDALVVLRMKRGSQRIRIELIRMDLRDELVGISFKRGGSQVVRCSSYSDQNSVIGAEPSILEEEMHFYTADKSISQGISHQTDKDASILHTHILSLGFTSLSLGFTCFLGHPELNLSLFTELDEPQVLQPAAGLVERSMSLLRQMSQSWRIRIPVESRG